MNEAEREISKRDRKEGWRSFHSGPPDFVQIKVDSPGLNGTITAVRFKEVKKPGEKLRYTQSIWRKALEFIGATYILEHFNPDQTEPNHTTPLRAMPRHTTPLHTTPARAIPPQSMPTQTKPAQPNPLQSTPCQTSPTHARPDRSRPDRASPDQSKPVQKGGDF